MASNPLINREGTEKNRARQLANLEPFPKGVSGNPAGRPKSITLSEALRLQLAKVSPHADERTYAEEIARVLCVNAARGNVNASREIADRTEGKPKQAIDVEMNVRDWRQMARAHGLSEQDVIREAQRLIESATDSSLLESN
jgi:DNA helicase HerA-like ATPase